MVKRLLTSIIVLVLAVGNLSVPTKAEEISDKERAIAVIDNLIVELKEIGYDKFDSDVLNQTLSDSYLWREKYKNILENIKVNDNSLRTYDGVYNTFIFGNIGGLPGANVGIDNNYGLITENYYYCYLSELLIFEKILKEEGLFTIKEIIDGSKNIDTFNSLDYYIWLRNTGLTFTYYINKDFVSSAQKTYIWNTLMQVGPKAVNEGHYEFEDNTYKYIYTTKSERLDDFVKCLELLDEELNNPFMSKIDVSVVVNGNTQYDQYQTELNVDKDVTQNTNNTNSKTNNSATTNKGTTNSKISVAGKKVSELKLVGKKGKVKISFAKLQNAKSYEIQISTNKKFKKAKTYTVNKTSKTIKKLKRKKTYYVRVRAVSGNTKSKWVKKKIKTK